MPFAVERARYVSPTPNRTIREGAAEVWHNFS
jgi:hypothetical protein